MEESAQVWILDPSGGGGIFRVRRMVGNELKVEKMELNHSVPLQYDFLRISNMLPEALKYGGKCVPRQCEVLLSVIATTTSKGCGKDNLRPLGMGE